MAGACFSLLPYWSAALGGPHPPVGLLRCYALAQLASTPLICRLSDVAGRRLPLAGCLLASAAAFAGGPVALAWSRFDAAARDRVQARYLEAIAPWREGRGYRVPAEFMIVTARRPTA